MKKQVGLIFRQFIALACAVLIVQSQAALFAQEALPPQPRSPIEVQQQDLAPMPAAMPAPMQAAEQPESLLAPAQLDSLVAPLALYPDPLLSQVLVASTYPLEIVEAAQWVQQNPNLKGAAIQDAVKQQNWDPSIQALTAFPDVLKELSGNIQWTTQLGNAFLAQQPAVMDAVQRLRGQAVSSGKLNSTPEQVVTTQTQGNTSAVEIQPANPQEIYVPAYDPMAIWGPPAFYPYPYISYPFYPIVRGRYIGFGAGIMVGAFFGGFGGWYGWGWQPNWFGRSIIVNNGFFSRYGYGRGVIAGGVWAHDPAHRMGVPYANRQVASQFRASAGSPAIRNSAMVRPQAAAVARSLAARSTSSQAFSRPAAARSFASSAPARSAYSSRPSVSNNFSSRTYASSSPRAAAPTQSSRSYSSPSRVAPSSQSSRAPSYSAPSSRGGSVGHASSGGGHSSGGHGRR